MPLYLVGTYYQLKTDHELNQKLFGHDGPRLVRSGDVVNYPYTAGTFAEIPTSIKGASAYYYFYDILCRIKAMVVTVEFYLPL